MLPDDFGRSPAALKPCTVWESVGLDAKDGFFALLSPSLIAICSQNLLKTQPPLWYGRAFCYTRFLERENEPYEPFQPSHAARLSPPPTMYFAVRCRP